MVTKLSKKNPIIKNLFSRKFKPKIVKAKKVKEVMLEKKIVKINLMIFSFYTTLTLKLITILSFSDSFFATL